uniref:hypothetical protein n=1 Tax=Trichocoleus desertorum TaxID=1481672 RepID=UPI0025B503BF|nr:hypothetical protein [Trichocoleus desertorum]
MQATSANYTVNRDSKRMRLLIELKCWWCEECGATLQLRIANLIKLLERLSSTKQLCLVDQSLARKRKTVM